MGLNSQLHIDNIKKLKQSMAKKAIEEQIEKVGESDLKEVRGIGEGTIAKLAALGVKNKHSLRMTSFDKIEKAVTNAFTLKAIKEFLNK